jgi:cellulose biosynthesis protein BcsQ
VKDWEHKKEEADFAFIYIDKKDALGVIQIQWKYPSNHIIIFTTLEKAALDRSPTFLQVKTGQNRA